MRSTSAAWYSRDCHSRDVFSGFPASSHRTYARISVRFVGMSTAFRASAGTSSRMRCSTAARASALSFSSSKCPSAAPSADAKTRAGRRAAATRVVATRTRPAPRLAATGARASAGFARSAKEACRGGSRVDIGGGARSCQRSIATTRRRVRAGTSPSSRGRRPLEKPERGKMPARIGARCRRETSRARGTDYRRTRRGRDAPWSLLVSCRALRGACAEMSAAAERGIKSRCQLQDEFKKTRLTR